MLETLSDSPTFVPEIGICLAQIVLDRMDLTGIIAIWIRANFQQSTVNGLKTLL